MAGSLLVKSKVQELVKKLGMRLSGDALEAIDGRVESTVKKAAKRAEANGRKTIMAHDI